MIEPARFSWRTLSLGMRELRHHGDLLWTLTAHRIRVRYKQSALGLAWAIVQPAAMTTIFVAVFTLLGGMPTGGVPYPLFAYTALLPWSFFSTAVGTATNGLVSQSQLVTKVYFPREILPLTYVIAASLDFAIGSSVLAVLLVYYRVSLSTTALAAVPVFLLLFALATAVALVLSAIQVRFRDVGIAMPLLLQLWFFATPIVYPLSAVPVEYRRLFALNPLAGLMENFRSALLQADIAYPQALAAAALFVAVALPAAYVAFKHVEATMADSI